MSKDVCDGHQTGLLDYLSTAKVDMACRMVIADEETRRLVERLEAKFNEILRKLEDE